MLFTQISHHVFIGRLQILELVDIANLPDTSEYFDQQLHFLMTFVIDLLNPCQRICRYSQSKSWKLHCVTGPEVRGRSVFFFF